MYTDYQFYTDDYYGSVIPDADSYAHNALFADEIISALTMGKADAIATTSPVYEKLKLAECAIVDELFKEEMNSGVVSEHVGDHSKSFANPSERQRYIMRRASVFLRNTGLLYRGL